MKLLIAGICGFAGLTVACELQNRRCVGELLTILGVGNFLYPDSELNYLMLKSGKFGSMSQVDF
jgi:nucleoside-diphosphate-sugar epimerase